MKYTQASPATPVMSITALVTMSAGSRHIKLTTNHSTPPAARIKAPAGYTPKLLTPVPIINSTVANHFNT